MSQSDTDKTLAAEERSEETRSFVRRVRSATRRKYSPEEKIRIVLEGFRREVFQASFLLLVDQGFHGGRQGEAFPL